MSNDLKKLRIGTRGSPLALVQTHMVRDALLAAHDNLEIEVKIIKTSGDWCPQDGEVRLAVDAGGKAQFAKEIEEALLAGAIDCAVHSMKDMETKLPQGLEIKHMLPREDARDAILFNNLADNGQNISDLPHGAVVGTASVRRQAFLLSKRPDLKIVPFRGNVQTRIEKLRAGQVDATLLAIAGLNRLGLADEASSILGTQDMLPAAAQGAVGIETRLQDLPILDAIFPLDHEVTNHAVEAERAFLRRLEGGCQVPIGAYATIDGNSVHLTGMVGSLDGKRIIKSERTGNTEDPGRVGYDLAGELLDQGASEILKEVYDNNE